MKLNTKVIGSTATFVQLRVLVTSWFKKTYYEDKKDPNRGT